MVPLPHKGEGFVLGVFSPVTSMLTSNLLHKINKCCCYVNFASPYTGKDDKNPLPAFCPHRNIAQRDSIYWNTNKERRTLPVCTGSGKNPDGVFNRPPAGEYYHTQNKGLKREEKNVQIKRGDIYYADLSPVVGSEQGGVRPVLIIQNDVGNKYSPTVIAAAITSRLGKNKLPTHIDIYADRVGLAKDSVVLLEQVRTIDKQRLGEKMGHLDDATMTAVDDAMAISLGLRFE